MAASTNVEPSASRQDGPSPAAVPSKLVTVGPHRGYIPLGDHRQQRTLAVGQRRSSTPLLGQDSRSFDQPGSLSHGGSHIGHGDRKSTRLNSSHVKISYAVFCLKKKKK